MTLVFYALHTCDNTPPLLNNLKSLHHKFHSTCKMERKKSCNGSLAAAANFKRTWRRLKLCDGEGKFLIKIHAECNDQPRDIFKSHFKTF